MSNKNKNAVKKAAPNKRLQKRYGETFADVINRKFLASEKTGTDYGKIMEQEFMLMALKRMGLLGPKRLRQLNEMLITVRHEYAQLVDYDISASGNNDKEFEYTKEMFDREMKNVLGEENYVGWVLNMDIHFYTEGIRQLQIREAYEKAKLEKDTRLKKLEELAKPAADGMSLEIDGADFFAALSDEEKFRISRSINNGVY